MAGDLIVADDWAGAAAEWIARHAGRSIALAGGTTPRAVYARLALPWAEINFYFSDERAVPPDHPESNFRMARELLPAARLHRMESAEEYARILPEPLDLLYLGMGEDGHTASLFPGSPALEETRRVVAVRGPDRITITPPVIASARALLVVATGAAKAAMVRRAREGPWDPRAVPAQLARHGTWIVDRAAASG